MACNYSIFLQKRIQLRKMKLLKQFGITPFTHGALKLLLYDYKSPNDKISRLISSGDIIPLKKGIYVISEEYRDQKISKEVMANLIYGPSYVSLDSALSYYGMIPEKVTVTISLTPKRAKIINNFFGDFIYLHSSAHYYSIGITRETIDNQYHFLISTPEKALCDKIVFTKNLNINSLKSMQQFLFEDLRVDSHHFTSFDHSVIEKCIKSGHKKKELGFLIKAIRKFK